MNTKMFCTLALGAAMIGGLSARAQDLTGGAGDSKTPQNPSQGGMTSGSTGSSGMISDQDKQFIQQASLGDYTEITFSQLAVQKASDPKVKAYAQRMITDHQMLEQKMQPFAQQAGVTPATALDSTHQQLYDQLNQLSGTAFDKQYMTAMDQDHHKTLDEFKTEETSTQNKQMKPVVKQGEKVVAQHTKMADSMVKGMGGATNGM
jgi:putative membrane protein